MRSTPLSRCGAVLVALVLTSGAFVQAPAYATGPTDDSLTQVAVVDPGDIRAKVASPQQAATLRETLPESLQAAEVWGPYAIVNVNSNKCMNVRDASLANLAEVVQYVCSSTLTNDIWWLVDSGANGYYYLVNDYSAKCLNAKGGSTANLVPLIQYSCGSTLPNDLWTYTDDFYIKNLHSQKCANAKGGSTANLVPIIQFTCGSTLPNDMWVFVY